MVGEVEVSRVGIRDGLSVDLTVQMEDPRDYDFRPSLHFEHTTLTVKSQTDGSVMACLLYTSPSPRDRQKSRMPSSA